MMGEYQMSDEERRRRRRRVGQFMRAVRAGIGDTDMASTGFDWVVAAPPGGSSFSSLRIVDNLGRRVVAPNLEN